MKKQYDISITRVETKTEVFTVLAESQPEAIELALEQSYNTNWSDFSTGDAEYNTTNVTIPSGWTLEDSQEAMKQGWNIFWSEGSFDGLWQLQRIDEPEEGNAVFENDKTAWEFVYKQFLVGDKLAHKALLYLSENCIEEFNRIKQHCESLNLKVE